MVRTTYSQRPRRPKGEDTPLGWHWKRKVYERLFFPVWPLLREGLTPVTPDGRYPAEAIIARISSAAERRADLTAPDEQETFLEAMDASFGEPIGPIVPGCRCQHCREAGRMVEKEARVPREARLRAAFIDCVCGHIEILLDTPNAYDRRDGLPPVIRRYRR
jgi:hypothetical protein